jgi:acetyl esterase/lipase
LGSHDRNPPSTISPRGLASFAPFNSRRRLAGVGADHCKTRRQPRPFKWAWSLEVAHPFRKALLVALILLIQVGAAETLLDDALALAKAAGAADVYVDLQIWPEMIHVWHLFHPELKAGMRAIDSGGAFVWERRAG